MSTLDVIAGCFRLIPAGTRGKTRMARTLLTASLPEREVSLRDRDGNRFFIPSLREPIGFHLLIDGTYEDKVLDLVLEALGPDSVFVDVGANIGVFSISACRRVAPRGAVLAVEASPQMFQYLKRNVEANGLNNVRCVEAAAHDVEGEVSFYEAPADHFGMGSLGARFHSHPITIRARRLDDLVREAGLARVDVIKIDVEGAEAGVLKGARGLLESERPPLVVFEFCDWAEATATSRSGDAQRFLMELGYHIWTFDDYVRGRPPLAQPLESGYGMLVARKERHPYRLAVVNSHPIQYFAPLYRRLAQTPDIDVMVFYCSRQGLDPGHVDPGFGREVVWDIPLLEGYKHRFLRNVGGDRGVGGFFSLLNPAIVREIWTGRFDAVLLHGHSAATNLLALLAAKAAGARVFMRGETHLLLERGALKRRVRGPLMRALYRLCDACLYIGAMNRRFYEAHGVPQDKLFRVPYTVDNAAFRESVMESAPRRKELKAALGIGPEKPVVLFASKLIARKRPQDLLEAFAGMARSGFDAALVFVGEGELLDVLRQRVRDEAIPGVHFAGFKNQSELPSYFALADVFVLPSENEPWGLVLNEVMSAGIPVITTTEVGARADLVIDGVSGFAYERGDVAELRRLLELVLGDAALRARLSRGAAERMQTWSYDEAIAGIRAALRSTCPPRRRERSPDPSSP